MSNIVNTLDRLSVTRAAADDRAFVPPTGPRTLGSEDELWTRDLASLTDTQRLLELNQTERLAPCDMNDLVVVLAARAEDPTMIFDDIKQARALHWLMGRFKRTYQAIRIAGKKPWPEFLSSLLNPGSLSTDDCGALYTMLGTAVGHVAPCGTLVIPRPVRDASFSTVIVDARTANESALGTLCREAMAHTSDAVPSADAAVMRAQASALGMVFEGVPRQRLASKLASRYAALEMLD